MKGTIRSFPIWIWTTEHPGIQQQTWRSGKYSRINSRPNPNPTTHSDQKQSQIPITLRQLQQRNRKSIARQREKNHQDRTRNKPNKYFCSHSCCGYYSKYYRYPQDNHRSDATFSNMRGGKTYRCFWINPQNSWLSGITWSRCNLKPWLYYSFNVIPPSSLNTPLIQGISHIGSTSNNISRHHGSSCINILPSINCPSSEAADGKQMQATHSAHVTLSQ